MANDCQCKAPGNEHKPEVLLRHHVFSDRVKQEGQERKRCLFSVGCVKMQQDEMVRSELIAECRENACRRPELLLTPEIHCYTGQQVGGNKYQLCRVYEVKTDEVEERPKVVGSMVHIDKERFTIPP